MISVADNCGSRLPCGLCLITNSPCPYSNTTVTWTSSNSAINTSSNDIPWMKKRTCEEDFNG